MVASVWNAGGKSIIPNKNLIVNIGFNEFATNTLSYSKVDQKSLKFLELDNNNFTSLLNKILIMMQINMFLKIILMVNIIFGRGDLYI